MSTRWSFQVRKGLFFAILIVIAKEFGRNHDKSFLEELSTLRFWISFSLLLCFCIFIFGYLLWKTKDDKNYSWSSIFRIKNK